MYKLFYNFHQQISSNNLVIKSLRPEDKGFYTCRAKNDAGIKYSLSAELRVFGLIKFNELLNKYLFFFLIIISFSILFLVLNLIWAHSYYTVF